MQVRSWADVMASGALPGPIIASIAWLATNGKPSDHRAKWQGRRATPLGPLSWWMI